MENTLLYFPNEVFTAAFDGVPTFISPLVGLTTYFVVTLATTGAFVPERTAPAVPAAPYSKNGRVLSGPTVRVRSVPRSS